MPSSAVERAAAAARLAVLAARIDVELPADTDELIARPPLLACPEERRQVEARLAALEARYRAEQGDTGC